MLCPTSVQAENIFTNYATIWRCESCCWIYVYCKAIKTNFLVFLDAVNRKRMYKIVRSLSDSGMFNVNAQRHKKELDTLCLEMLKHLAKNRIIALLFCSCSPTNGSSCKQCNRFKSKLTTTDRNHKWHTVHANWISCNGLMVLLYENFMKFSSVRINLKVILSYRIFDCWCFNGEVLFLLICIRLAKLELIFD